MKNKITFKYIIIICLCSSKPKFAIINSDRLDELITINKALIILILEILVKVFISCN